MHSFIMFGRSAFLDPKSKKLTIERKIITIDSYTRREDRDILELRADQTDHLDP